MELDKPQSSTMSVWPTKEKPDEYYKITSAYVTLTRDLNVIERQTYSFLEWLGDIGGLYDALRLIGLIIVAPYSAFRLRSELLSYIFRFVASKRFTEVHGKPENEADLFGEGETNQEKSEWE